MMLLDPLPGLRTRTPWFVLMVVEIIVRIDTSLGVELSGVEYMLRADSELVMKRVKMNKSRLASESLQSGREKKMTAQLALHPMNPQEE